jgi:autotransporter-associated beta strand protein
MTSKIAVLAIILLLPVALCAQTVTVTTATTATGVTITLGAGGTLANSGTITSTGSTAVRVTTLPALVENAAGARIQATAANKNAIELTAGGTVRNSGVITGGGSGIVATGADTLVRNTAGASITGLSTASGYNGVELRGARSSLVNEGLISGRRGLSVYAAGFLVENRASGTIIGTADNALSLDTGASGTLLNTGAGAFIGMTLANKTALYIAGGVNAAIVNSDSASIRGTSTGLYLNTSATATVTNTAGALIRGDTAPAIGARANSLTDILNTTGARITGGGSGADNPTVWLLASATMTVTNTASALIISETSSAFRARETGANLTVLNTGSAIISAFTTAFDIVASNTLRLTNENARVTGNVAVSATGAAAGGLVWIDNRAGGLIEGATGTAAIWLAAGSGTIFNSGTISGATGLLTTIADVFIQNNTGGLITGLSTASGKNGVELRGARSSLVNAGGTITGFRAITTHAPGTFIENRDGGVIIGHTDNTLTFDVGSSGTLLNTGSGSAIRMDLTGRTGLFVNSATVSVLNSDGAAIRATGAAIYLYASTRSLATLVNTGAGSLIHSDSSNAVNIANNAATITNAAGAVIDVNPSANAPAIRAGLGAGGTLTLTNTGNALIAGGTLRTAIEVQAGAFADILNTGGARITGGASALDLIAATASARLDNAATITGSVAIRSTGSLAIINRADGAITGAAAAILVDAGTATITNNKDALIAATGAGAAAIRSSAADVSITNSGTIRGAADGTAAIVFSATTGANGTLTLDTGSVLEGDVTSAAASGNRLFLLGSGSGDSNFTGDAALAGSGFETLAMSGTAWTLSGSLALTGSAADSLNVASGTLTLTGALARPNNAGLAVGAGARLVLALADMSALTAPASLAAGGALEFAPAADSVFSGTISGAGGLVKSGPARQTLSGLNTFTGQTLVNAGALVVSGSAARLRGDIAVAAGATLGGQENVGVAGKTIALQPGSSLLVGTAAQPQTLTVDGTLALNSASVLLDLHAANASDRLLIAPGGALTLAGSNTVAIGAFVSGTFNLGNIAALSGAAVTVGGLAVTDPSSRQSAVLAASGGDLILTAGAGASRILKHTGDTASFIWSASGAPALPFADGDTLVLDGAADAAYPQNRYITFAGMFVTVSDLRVSGTAGYTLGGAAIIADKSSVVAGSTEITGATATGRLVKTGAGRLALAGSGESHFKGGVELGGGVLALESPGALGPSNLAVTAPGVTLEIASAGVDLSGSVAFGTHGLAIDTTGRDARVSGAITGAGALEKHGAGVLALAGANTFSGGLDIGAGAVSFAANENLASGAVTLAATATLALDRGAAGDFAFDRALAGAGVFSVSLATGTDRFSLAPVSGTAFAGELRLERAAFALDAQNAAALAAATLRVGPAALVEKAPGDLALGALAFSGGTLALPVSADGLPDGLLTTGTLDTGAGGVIAMDVSRFTTGIQNPPVPPAPGLFDNAVMTDTRLVAADVVTGAGVFTLADRATGAALPSPTTIDITQSGEAVATANYGHAVATQTSGTAQGLYLAYGITGINILADKTLLLDNTGATNSTLAAVISGPGDVDLRAAAGSPLTLAAANTFTGATHILAGVVKISHTAALSSSAAVEIAGGALLDISGKASAGNRDFPTIRELTGSGTILLGAAELAIEVNGTTGFSGVILGGGQNQGRIQKTGTGTLTLSGDNKYGNRTYIYGGRLRVTSPTALGSGPLVHIAATAVLEFNGIPETVLRMRFTNGGRIEVVDSVLAFEAPNNQNTSLAISGRSFVTAVGSSTTTGAGSLGSLGAGAVAVTVGAGSTLAIAPRSVINNGIITANTGTVGAGSLALDGGRLLLAPGATLGVEGTMSIAAGGKIGFTGGGVSHLLAGDFAIAVPDPLAMSGTSFYDVPAGMTFTVAARPGGGYDYMVVNQSASPLRGLNLAFNATAAALDAVGARLDDHFLLPSGGTPPDPRRAWKNTAWLKGLAGETDCEDTATLPGHAERMRGLVLGLDASLRDRLLLGLYAGTTDSDLATTNGLKVDFAQQLLGACAALRLGMFYVNAGLTVGKVDADVFRAEPAGRTDGTYAGSHLGGSVGAGLVWRAWKGGAVTPSVTLRHTRVKLRDYEERGPGAMLVPDFSDKLRQSIVRVRADQSFTLLGRAAAAGFSLGWKQALKAPRDRLVAAFASDPETSIELLGIGEPRASALLGLGFRAALSKHTVLSLAAEHELTTARTRDTASLSLAHSW